MLYNTHSTLVHTEHRHYYPEQIPSKSGPNFQFLKLDISVAGGWPGAGPAWALSTTASEQCYLPTISAYLVPPLHPVKCSVNTLCSSQV